MPPSASRPRAGPVGRRPQQVASALHHPQRPDLCPSPAIGQAQPGERHQVELPVGRQHHGPGSGKSRFKRRDQPVVERPRRRLAVRAARQQRGDGRSCRAYRAEIENDRPREARQHHRRPVRLARRPALKSTGAYRRNSTSAVPSPSTPWRSARLALRTWSCRA